MLIMRCDELAQAVQARDAAAFDTAMQATSQALRQATPDQLTEAAKRIAALLASMPLGVGSQVAVLAGAMVEYGAEPNALVEPLVTRLTDALETAARFPGLWRKLYGEDADWPSAEDESAIGPTFDSLQADAESQGIRASEAFRLGEAWFTSANWARPMLPMLQRKDVRLALPHRDRLTAAAGDLADESGTIGWMYGLLQVLDEASLTVVHRPTSRGYRLTASGIGDNFQLHTLLAAALIGDESRGLLPGTPPTDEEIAAASTGPLRVEPALYGRFNLLDAHGKWIWNEGRPADIPLLDGERIIVLEDLSYERSWNPGRLYPSMPPELRLDQVLTPAQVSALLSRVAPTPS